MRTPPGREADYTLNEDLAEHARRWIGQQTALAPDGPLFLYYSPGGTHAPLQAPKAWIDRFISPTMVNEARVAWGQFNNNLVGHFANNTNVQATLQINGLVAPSPVAYGLPLVGLGGGISSFGGVPPWVTRDDLFQWIEGLSIVKGKHSMKVGDAIGRDRYNETGTLKATGEFDFDGQSTNNPSVAGSGSIFADFLLGYSSQSYRVAQLANAQLRRTSYVGYLQDDWKVTPKITVNLGLRYENTRPRHDKYSQLINAQVFGTGVTTAPLTGPRYTTPPRCSRLVCRGPLIRFSLAVAGWWKHSRSKLETPLKKRLTNPCGSPSAMLVCCFLSS